MIKTIDKYKEVDAANVAQFKKTGRVGRYDGDDLYTCVICGRKTSIDGSYSTRGHREVLKMDKFETGQVVVTAGVAAKMEHNPGFIKFILVSFKRYETCDWGNIRPDDAKMNDKAVKNGDDRILAMYEDEKYGKIWIITERDRSVTTILFPSEY